MDDLLNQRKPEPKDDKPPVTLDGEAKYDLTREDAKNFYKELTEVRRSLQSIRGMLQFFVVLIILGIILQACSALGLM